ncbi:MAG: hypothetical protein COA78_02440 [Blastopirellula sp.]|nr:MAG: hypothetical protein COA78_02440 [Blastopirellula sp.]
MDLIRLTILAALGLSLVGCGSKPSATQPSTAQRPVTTSQQTTATIEDPGNPTAFRQGTSKKPETAPPKNEGERLFNQFMNNDNAKERFKPGPIQVHEEFEADPAKLSVAGIRTISGTHLTLYTDLPASAELNSFPALFDAAFPHWCSYFHVDPAKHANWKIKACLMSGKEKFSAAGLLPGNLPEFLYGYARNDTVWLLDQPSDYYQRHLLLHEGTHAFMNNLLGGAGPPWYMEGMAEYFGTHSWDGKKLEVGIVPNNKLDVPMWGRIKIIKEEYKAQRGMTLGTIMIYGPTAHLQNEPYGWCWGAVTYLDHNPRSQKAFRESYKNVRFHTDLSRRLLESLADQWPEISEGWQLFVVNSEYGYDFARNDVQYKKGQAITGASATAMITADRGWQSTGILLEAGKTYQLSASGQYQIAQEDNQPWMSEPNGITLRYYNGFPLGMLMCGLRADNWNGQGTAPLAFQEPVGSQRELKIETNTTLYLKVNDHPAQLGDNIGNVTIEVKEVESAR